MAEIEHNMHIYIISGSVLIMVATLTSPKSVKEGFHYIKLNYILLSLLVNKNYFAHTLYISVQ